MLDRSIVTKIAASVCGMVFILLLTGSFGLIKFEISLVDRFARERLDKINQSIDDRERAEKASLQRNVRFNTEILSGMSVLFLDMFDPEGLRHSLRSYMNYPEIVAVRVLDEDEAPFAAAWKTSDIMTGDALPDDLLQDDWLSVQVDAFRDGKKWGSLEVFYTEGILREKIRLVKEKASIEAETFRNRSESLLNKAILNQSIGAFFILLVLTLCLSVSVRAIVLEPLNRLSGTARHLADFDLTVRLDTNRRDEAGDVLRAMGQMVAEFRKILREVKSGGESLAQASGQMMQTISAVASSAEEISASVQSVSENASEMLQSNTTVAGTIEKMTAAMNEVRVNAHQGASIATQAVAMADTAGGTMCSLGETANEISEVTELIKRIADKTTLLALNADIEAASAGEAGKGFAVVANEIKEFARQSTLAANDIAARISLMQEKAQGVAMAIGDVSGIVFKMDHHSETISIALEEQMNAANDIASHAEQASIRAGDIAASMEELAKGANQVSMRVGMAAGEKETLLGHADMPHIDASAAEVAKLAQSLLDLVGKFKLET